MNKVLYLLIHKLIQIKNKNIYSFYKKINQIFIDFTINPKIHLLYKNKKIVIDL
jgi:hypothetical protein